MTTIARLNERAQEAFHVALETKEQTGRWDPALADEYLNREADLRWEESQVAINAQMAADHDYHLDQDITVMECDDCITVAEPGWVATYHNQDEFIEDMRAWAPGEIQEQWGK